MRMRASWFGSQRPTGYKVAARAASCPDRELPSDGYPDQNERAVVLRPIKARPGNDGA
jgi:hypothetical protein